MVDLIPVESTMLKSAGYDPEKHSLYVVFNTGKGYEYYQVPAEEYQGLMAAESKGTYMRTHILSHYAYGNFKP